jgi:hypothetical protein
VFLTWDHSPLVDDIWFLKRDNIKILRHDGSGGFSDGASNRLARALTRFSLILFLFYLSISLDSRRQSIVLYLRIMAVARSDELRHSPAARDTKSSSRVIAIIIRSLNNTPFYNILHT